MSVRLVVYGRCAPKGSHSLGRRKDGSAFVRPASKYQKAWTEAVAHEARCEGTLLDPPYEVDLSFFIARPVKPKYAWPTQSDLDKLVRATVDGLVAGGLLLDDRHVTRSSERKSWAVNPESECCVIRLGNPPTNAAAALRAAA